MTSYSIRYEHIMDTYHGDPDQLRLKRELEVLFSDINKAMKNSSSEELKIIYEEVDMRLDYLATKSAMEQGFTPDHRQVMP